MLSPQRFHYLGSYARTTNLTLRGEGVHLAAGQLDVQSKRTFYGIFGENGSVGAVARGVFLQVPEMFRFIHLLVVLVDMRLLSLLLPKREAHLSVLTMFSTD